VIRWALKVRGNDLTPDYLLGPLCWHEGEPGPVRTFATRREARESKRSLRAYSRYRAQPVKVRVTIEETH
jgi:hypothetical protein